MSDPAERPQTDPGDGRPRPRGKRKPKRKLHTRLHRWLGLWSFAILLVIAVTGIALNHTEALDLDGRQVKADPILKRYGMQPGGEPVVFVAGGHLLAHWDGECLFDEAPVYSAPEGAEMVAAGMVNADEFAFVFPREVIVCDVSGNLVDRLDAASLPDSAIESAGRQDGELVLKLSSGRAVRLVDWLEATPLAGQVASWFAPEQNVSASQRERLASGLRGQGLPLSRVVLDLHSGRLFGNVGVVLYDLSAICLIVLGITGIRLWLRRR